MIRHDARDASEPPAVWALLALEHGHNNAVGREVLARRYGLSDRIVREKIEAARDEGVLICNDQDGKGYYLAETVDEIERQYRRDKARALNVLKRLKASRRALKAAGRAV